MPGFERAKRSVSGRSVAEAIAFPGFWAAYVLWSCLTDQQRDLRPFLAVCIGFSCYAIAFGISTSKPIADEGVPSGSSRSFVVLDSVLTLAAIAVASFTTTAFANAIRDPIGGWNSPDCRRADAFVVPSGFGKTATFARLECGGGFAGMGYDVQLVFVHGAGEENGADNLVFRYEPTERGDIPRLRWNRDRTLTISLRPDNIRTITTQRTSLDDITVVYDIRLGCTATYDTVSTNEDGTVAILSTASCSTNDPEKIHYVHSVFVHRIGEQNSSQNEVFQYEPTEFGVEFDSPIVRWSRPRDLVIALRYDDIQKSSRRRSTIGAIHVHYEIGSSNRRARSRP